MRNFSDHSFVWNAFFRKWLDINNLGCELLTCPMLFILHEREC